MFGCQTSRLKNVQCCNCCNAAKPNLSFSNVPHGQAKTTLAPSESAAASSYLRVVFTRTPCGDRHVLSCIHAHPASDRDLIPAKPQSSCHVLLPYQCKYIWPSPCSVFIPTLTQVHIGVLNGKYDLAGSEFKIWPSNYDLEVDKLEREKLNIWLGFASQNYPHPDHNLGHILNSNPYRSYFPPEFSEILLKSIIVIQHSTDPVNRERGI